MAASATIIILPVAFPEHVYAIMAKQARKNLAFQAKLERALHLADLCVELDGMLTSAETARLSSLLSDIDNMLRDIPRLEKMGLYRQKLRELVVFREKTAQRRAFTG